MLLEGPGDIGEVGFAGVVEQAGQGHPAGVVSGQSLAGAVETVLAHGEKGLDVSVAPAEQGERMGHVRDAHAVRVGAGGEEVDPGVGGDKIVVRHGEWPPGLEI